MPRIKPRPEIDYVVGKRIKYAREQLGITQAALAKKLDIRRQQLDKYESGINSFTLTRLILIAEALGLPLGHFLKGIGELKEYPYNPKTGLYEDLPKPLN